MNEIKNTVDAIARHGGAAVLTAVDPSGYPVSTVCRPVPSPDGSHLVVVAPDWFEFVDGPASLSAHSHDDKLWNMREFLAKGSVRRGSTAEFTPISFTVLVTGKISLRFLRDTRRAAATHLRRRGLARPTIPWDVIEAAKAATPTRQLRDAPGRTP